MEYSSDLLLKALLFNTVFILIMMMVEAKMKNLPTRGSLIPGTKQKFLFHPCTYQPDFVFYVTQKFRDAFPKLKWDYVQGVNVYADIKGGWTKGDEVKAYNIIRKWVYQKHGIYVQTIKIGGAAPKNNLFLQTWAPESARLTLKTKQVVRKYEGMKTIKEYM